jgi:hypothetical protein
LHQLAAGGRPRGQLSGGTEVVGRLQHGLAGQRFDRDPRVRAEWDREHDPVPRPRGLLDGRRRRVCAELADEAGQGMGATGVTDDDVQSRSDRESRQGAAHLSATDECESAHRAMSFRLSWGC